MPVPQRAGAGCGKGPPQCFQYCSSDVAQPHTSPSTSTTLTVTMDALKSAADKVGARFARARRLLGLATRSRRICGLGLRYVPGGGRGWAGRPRPRGGAAHMCAVCGTAAPSPTWVPSARWPASWSPPPSPPLPPPCCALLARCRAPRAAHHCASTGAPPARRSPRKTCARPPLSRCRATRAGAASLKGDSWASGTCHPRPLIAQAPAPASSVTGA